MLIVTIALGFLGLLLLWRLPRVGITPPPELPHPPLSIIIPARNEAKNLPRLLASLQDRLPAGTEILVADDGSTDATASLARTMGATLISVPPKPGDWIGKTWACHHAALQSKGQWLLFLDADTWFEPGGLAILLNHFSALGGGVLSVAPWHQLNRPHEQLSAFFNLVSIIAVGSFGLGRRQKPADGLFGPVLLVEKSAYDNVGGYKAVRDRILENFSLTKLFQEHDVTMTNLVGRGLISYRMYPEGLRELISGWSKGFASGAGQTPARTMIPLIAWFSGLMMAVQPGYWLNPASSWPWIAAYTLAAAHVWFQLRRIGSFHLLTAVVYPIPLAFYFLLFTWALVQKKRGKSPLWKGRTVHAP